MNARPLWLYPGVLLLTSILLGTGCAHTETIASSSTERAQKAAPPQEAAAPPVARQQLPHLLALDVNLSRSVGRERGAEQLRQGMRSYFIELASKGGVKLLERDLGDHAGLYVVDLEDAKLLLVIDLVAEAQPVLPRKFDLLKKAFIRNGRLVLLVGSPTLSQVDEVLAVHQQAPASRDILQLTVAVDRLLTQFHYNPDEMVDETLKLSGLSRTEVEALPMLAGYVRRQHSLFKGLQHVQTLKGALAFEEDGMRLSLSVDPVPGSPLAQFARSHQARPLQSAFRFHQGTPSLVVFSDLQASAANDLNQSQLEDLLTESPWSEPEKAFLKAATSNISSLRSGTVSLSAWTNPDGKSSSLLFIESPQGEELIRNLLDVSALVTARRLAVEAEQRGGDGELPYVQPTPPENVEQLLHQVAGSPIGTTRISNVSFEGTRVWHLQQRRYDLGKEHLEEEVLDISMCAVPEGVLVAAGPNSLHDVEGWIVGSRTATVDRTLQEALQLEKGPWMGLFLNVGVDREAIARLAPLQSLSETLSVGDLLAHLVAMAGSVLPELAASENMMLGTTALVAWSEGGLLQMQLSMPLNIDALSQASRHPGLNAHEGD